LAATQFCLTWLEEIEVILRLHCIGQLKCAEGQQPSEQFGALL
jgi:hypothetical protein